MAASFLFADGSVGNLTYCTVGTKTSGGERAEVFAPGIGAMTEDFKTLTIYNAMPHTRKRMWPDKGYDVQLRDFFDAIRQGREAAVTLRDGIRASVGCLRMLESARTREAVDIDLDSLFT